jgi:hypothetical protein
MGKIEIKKLPKTAILGTAHRPTAKSTNVEVKNVYTPMTK